MTSAGNKLFTVFGGPTGYQFQNATAETRVAELIAAGATLTDDQKAAIDDFHVARDAASGTWGAAILRLWLPCMEVVAANAIDIIGGNTGTFSGTTTPGATGVAGDGSTGFFIADLSAAAAGWTRSNLYIGTLALNASNALEALFGNTDNNAVDATTRKNGLNTLENVHTPDGPTNIAATGATHQGIVAITGDATTHRLRQRLSSGVSNLHTRASTASTTAAASTFGLRFMAFQNRLSVPTPSNFSTNTFGAFFIGTNMSTTDEDAFTLALKDLYESFTGNSLP